MVAFCYAGLSNVVMSARAGDVPQRAARQGGTAAAGRPATAAGGGLTHIQLEPGVVVVVVSGKGVVGHGKAEAEEDGPDVLPVLEGGVGPGRQEVVGQQAQHEQRGQQVRQDVACSRHSGRRSCSGTAMAGHQPSSVG